MTKPAGLRRAEPQVRVESCQVHQPLDDGLSTGDEELALLFGQALVCPDKYRKAAAVHETKCGKLHYEESRGVLQGTADGQAKPVPGTYVKFALQPQY